MTIELKLSRIYSAAHVDLPRQAGTFARSADALSGGVDRAVAQLGQASGGGELAGTIGDLGEELFVRLRQVVRTLNDSAIALDRIGDDFARTDAEAADWLDTHAQWLRDHPYLGDTPAVPALPEAPELEGQR